MAFDGNGVFDLDYDWNNDAANGIPITSSRVQAEDVNIANGLSNVICRDGQSTVTGDIPWNGHKITGLAAPAFTGDALSQGYDAAVNSISAGSGQFSGPITTSSSIKFLQGAAPSVAPQITFNANTLYFVSDTGGYQWLDRSAAFVNMSLSNAGTLSVLNTIQAAGQSFPVTGAGVEISFAATIGNLFSFDRGASAYRTMNYDAAEHTFAISSIQAMKIQASTGHLIPSANNTRDLGTSAIGWRNIYSNNALNIVSDARLKTDVEDIEGDTAISFMRALKPKQFRFLEGSCVTTADEGNLAGGVTNSKTVSTPGLRKHLGFIAQDVHEAATSIGMPDYAGWGLADKNDPDSLQSIRMGMLVSPAIAAIKSLVDKVQALEARVAVLEAK